MDVGDRPMQGGMHLTGGGGFYSNNTHHRGTTLEIHHSWSSLAPWNLRSLEFRSSLELKSTLRGMCEVAMQTLKKVLNLHNQLNDGDGLNYHVCSVGNTMDYDAIWSILLL